MKDIDNKVKVCFVTAYEVNYQALRGIPLSRPGIFHSETN
jgi:hypothetical protein